MDRQDAERLVKVEESVFRIEKRMEEGFSRLEEKIDDTSSDHRVRIRALEHWRWGVGASLIGLGSMIATNLGLPL